MSISALITEGIGPQGTVPLLLTGGLYQGAATVPSAPTIGTATAGDTQATVSFTESSTDGGSPILSHTATSTPGGITGTSLGAGSGSILVTGLTNGVSYTFTVHSTNAVGDSLESGPSNPVVPGVPEVATQGMGPGWNLFHHQPERVREPDSVRSDIEHALEKAEEARSPKAKREAVKELKAVTAEAAKTATEIPGLEFMAMRLERALQLKQSASALIADIRRVIEAQRLQEQDDLEAFMIMAELA